MKHTFESIVFWLVIASLMLSLVSAVSKASEREHDHQTINNVVVHKHDHDDLGKGIVIGVIATCGIRSLYYGFKDKRWTWCGEPKEPEPFPSIGPTP